MISGLVEGREARLDLTLLETDGNPRDVSVVLDTGFTGLLTLPPELVAACARSPGPLSRATLADGSQVVLRQHLVRLIWDGQSRDVLALETLGTPLLGMGLLVGSRLIADIVDGGLVSIALIPTEPVVSAPDLVRSSTTQIVASELIALARKWMEGTPPPTSVQLKMLGILIGAAQKLQDRLEREERQEQRQAFPGYVVVPAQRSPLTELGLPQLIDLFDAETLVEEVLQMGALPGDRIRERIEERLERLNQ